LSLSIDGPITVNSCLLLLSEGKESIPGNDSSVSSAEELLVIIGVASSMTIGELLGIVRAIGVRSRGESDVLQSSRSVDPQGKIRVAAW